MDEVLFLPRPTYCKLWSGFVVVLYRHIIVKCLVLESCFNVNN